MSRLRIELKVFGEPLAVEGPAPADQVAIADLLPFFRAVDDAVIDRAVHQVEAGGKRVSCAKGCSACCRAQPVPVTPPEAYALLRLVESMPADRQAEVRAAFADRVRRLRDAGLFDTFMARDPGLTRESARSTADAYFRLGLVCPFLVDDACGIYRDRPFVCRQYLVTTPATLCTDPLHNPVEPVPMPVRFAHAALETAEGLNGTPQHTVPLVLALEYAETHRDELERRFDGPDVFGRFMNALAAG
jgi:Fe-S-cluster containining protein